MGRCGVLLVRAAKADVRADGDQRWSIGLLSGVLQCQCNSFYVIALFHSLHMPTEGSEPSHAILGECQLCASLDSDVVICVKNDEFSKMLVACDRSRLR